MRCHLYFCSQAQSREQRNVRAPLHHQTVQCHHHIVIQAYSRADLLVDGLLKLLVVEDGPHLAVAVARPEWRGHLGLGLAHVSSAAIKCSLDLN